MELLKKRGLNIGLCVLFLSGIFHNAATVLAKPIPSPAIINIMPRNVLAMEHLIMLSEGANSMENDTFHVHAGISNIQVNLNEELEKYERRHNVVIKERLMVSANEMLDARSLTPPEKQKNILDEQFVPNNASGCKSCNFTYMDWHKVTSRSSKQYRVLNDESAWSDKETGIRMVNDRKCIAIGLGYGYSPGDMIDVYLTSGEVVECIIGDMKAPVDCDETERFQKHDGSVVEIIIDGNYFSSSGQYRDIFSGNVEKLVLVEEMGYEE